EEEQAKMPQNTKMDKAKNAAKSAANVMKEGAVRGMVGETNRQVIKKLEEGLGDKYPEFLKTTVGRKAVELAFPTLIYMACEFDEEGRIPGNAHIKRAAELAMNDASGQAMSNAVATVLQHLWPLLKEY